MVDKTNFTLEEIKEDCSELELMILERYLNRKTQKEIIEDLGCTRGKIDHLVARYKLNRFRDKSKYIMDESIIDILNPNYWYFLGFFAADGNLHFTGGSEVIQFTLKDREPLEDFIKIFRYTGTIKEYVKGERGNKYFHLQIINKKLVDSINSIFGGDAHRKTDTLIYPEIPNKDCESMFIRGFWDGDGCFTLSNNRRTYIGEMYCKSEIFMKGFYKCMEKHNIHVTGDLEHLRICENKSVSDFIHFIYSFKSMYGLPRKRALAFLHLYFSKMMI